MTGSPTAYLLWSILSSIFLVFLIVHLWLYDRFNCVKWDSGRQPGAFRRVMTYSYLATVPLMVFFSIVITYLKFQEGYFVMSTLSVMPRPLSFWSDQNRSWVFPLNLIFSIAWSLELVTHLEELAFWLFLLHQGPEKRAWFESWEYKTWYLGSLVAVVGMPLTAVVSRREIDKAQAWILLVGSIAGTSTTISFLYVLFRFPTFLRQVKEGGAEPDVVVRLATFFNLNRIRVVFRFLFTVPLLTIGVDALCPPYYVILNPFALDFLLMLGGIGCFVSSAITLFVFFPRSITRESGYTAKAFSPQHSEKVPTSTLPDYYNGQPHHTPPMHNMPQDAALYEYESYAPKAYPYLPHDNLSNSHTMTQAVVDGRQHQITFVHPTYEMYDGQVHRQSEDFSGDEEVGSPDYDSEVDDISSNNIPSRSTSHDVHRGMTQWQEDQLQAEYCGYSYPERQDNSNTVVSVKKSDDTMCEKEKEAATPHLMTPAAALAAATRAVTGTNDTTAVPVVQPLALPLRPSSPSPISRRHTDTSILTPNEKAALRTDSGGLPMSENGHTQGLHQRRTSLNREVDQRKTRESKSVSLHPYLMNWTSPIDLLDTFPSSNPQSSSHIV